MYANGSMQLSEIPSEIAVLYPSIFELIKERYELATDHFLEDDEEGGRALDLVVIPKTSAYRHWFSQPIWWPQI